MTTTSRGGIKPGPVGLRRWYGLLVWLLPALLGLAVQAGAYFEDVGLGVRPIGMGEAFVAVADDSNAVLWNAAGIAQLDMREINSAYSVLYTNLNARLYTGETDSLGTGNVGLAIPFERRIGSMAFFWSRFNSRFYAENTVSFTYGREIGSDLFPLLQWDELSKEITLDAGVNFKVLEWQITPNDYTNSNPVLGSGNLSRTGFTADLGVLVKTAAKWNFGLSFENIIPADVGVTVNETIPFNFRAGVSYLYEGDGHKTGGMLGFIDSVLGTLEFDTRNGISDIRAGAEGWLFNHMLAVRLGSTVDEFTTGASFYTPLNYSDMAVRLDYAFSYPYGISSTFGSHRFALVLRWGSVKSQDQSKMLPPEEYKAEESKIVLPAEENLAAKRELELAAQRAEEEAKYKALMAKFQEEIKKVNAELDRIKELIKLGQLPTIQFKSGRADLQRVSYKTLDQLGAILEKYPEIKVRLEGHTDSTGNSKTNQKLSQHRVEAVKEYLVGHFGLSPNNLIPVGFGDSRPIAGNKLAEGRAQNRRVEIRPLSPAGMETVLVAGETSEYEQKQDEVAVQDTAKYEDVEKIQEKLKVYRLQMKPGEVEEMFRRQHQQK